MWRAYVEMCDAMVFVVDASGDLEAQAKVLDTALALDEVRCVHCFLCMCLVYGCLLTLCIYFSTRHSRAPCLC